MMDANYLCQCQVISENIVGFLFSRKGTNKFVHACKRTYDILKISKIYFLKTTHFRNYLQLEETCLDNVFDLIVK